MAINEAHMMAGVTMIDPSQTYVDASVELASDVTLEPNVILRGAHASARELESARAAR